MIDFLHFEKVLYNKLGFYKYLTHDFNHKCTDKRMTKEFIKIGLVSISDRASSGAYEDKGITSLQDWLGRSVITPMIFETRLIADEQNEIESTLIDLVEHQNCH